MITPSLIYFHHCLPVAMPQQNCAVTTRRDSKSAESRDMELESCGTLADVIRPPENRIPRRWIGRLWILLVMISWVGMFTPSARAANEIPWLEKDFTSRRLAHVAWDADRNRADELAQVEFLTAGLLKADGARVVVRAADGNVMPSRLLQVGPGDQARVAFGLRQGQRDYLIYFGNPAAKATPQSQPELPQRGLLMEMNLWNGQPVNSSDQILRAWQATQNQPIGRILVDAPFLGVNPLGDQDRTIAKFSGSLYAPVDGDYQFAASADDRGALYIDGQPVVYAPYAVGDIRFNKTIPLKRGQHDFVFYEVNTGGELRFTVGWKRPDMPRVEPIQPQAFGLVRKSVPAVLEIQDQSLIADFSAEVKSEIFFADNYSYRVILTANPPPGSNITYTWELGDGTTATGLQVEHVYLTGGQFPVKLTVGAHGKADTRISSIWVRRDWQRAANPPAQEPGEIATIVAKYPLDQLQAESLRRAVLLQWIAEQRAASLEAAGELASREKHSNPQASVDAIRKVTLSVIDAGGQDAAIAIWEKVPAKSNLKPLASVEQASQLLWHLGDIQGAMKVLSSVNRSSPAARQQYAQLLVLTGRAEEGKVALEALPVRGDPDKRVALSGALARSVEFYIEEKDAESADEEWDRWADQFPMDFLDGYSMLLKVQIMQIRGGRAGAANLAEAFANALPQSSYGPSLLETAAKGIQDQDPNRAHQLRQLLKDKYPEDPRAQKSQ